MSTSPHAAILCQDPPGDYLTAMADIERRALQGQLTLAQVRHEIQSLRERLDIDAGVVARWAASRHDTARLGQR